MSARVAALLAALLGATPAAAATGGGEPGELDQLPQEPAVARAMLPLPSAFWQRRGWSPQLKFKVGYRTFAVADLADVRPRYHCFTLDAYLHASLLRAGIGLEVGAEDSARDNFLADLTLIAGVQYPAGLSPFVDVMWGGGFLRRDVYNTDLVGFIHHFGVEGGLELFLLGKFVASVALGWRRQVFEFDGNDQVETAMVYFDSFTVKVALGF